ncbi:hypothetical protein [Rhodoferax sp.]|uniref:hypothetical protein n=1 Tax=Rhodoferax sp. TaxID=50421 RepID=UPI0027236D70|nr:hypothetical protein [Rhodoferax sp.]MDO9197792.1 hypothetical protein [Rhodoferax sp.]
MNGSLPEAALALWQPPSVVSGRTTGTGSGNRWFQARRRRSAGKLDAASRPQQSGPGGVNSAAHGGRHSSGVANLAVTAVAAVAMVCQPGGVQAGIRGRNGIMAFAVGSP